MRIAKIAIRNYKGVACAEVDGLDQLPAVIFTGKNGTGKSLLLEALVFGWTAKYSDRDRVGSRSDEMSIEMTVTLGADEIAKVRDWHERAGREAPDPTETSHTLRRRFHRLNGQTMNEQDSVLQTLRDTGFQREYGFSIIDFLPSTRQIPLSGEPSVDLGIFAVDRQHQERENYLDGYMNKRGPVTLNNVPSYLLTVDYQNLIAQRQGYEIDDDYERITEPFRVATSKRITLPEFLPDQGRTRIAVELPTGHQHELAMLSSGEQELLALQYFIRRLQRTGGVLLLDEPEQHLHPSLQATLLSNVADLSSAAQVLIVSHSGALIASAPPGSLARLDAPSTDDSNQLRLVDMEGDRIALLGELGLHKASLIQVDYVLIVEGESDAHWIRAMFAAEVAHAHIVVAGGGSQVVSLCRAYRQAEDLLGVPWIAVRDRDFLSDDEIAAMTDEFPELHVHNGRELESLFLDPALLSDVLSAVGEEVSSEEIMTALEEAADPLTSDVILEWSRSEATRRFPPPAVSNDDPWEKWRAELAAYEAINRQRHTAVDQIRSEMTARVRARWASDKLDLADPKVVLRRLQTRFPRFRNYDSFTDALTARIRRHPESAPAGAREIRQRLRTAQGLDGD